MRGLPEKFDDRAGEVVRNVSCSQNVVDQNEELSI